jgi:hypothetical protein
LLHIHKFYWQISCLFLTFSVFFHCTFLRVYNSAHIRHNLSFIVCEDINSVFGGGGGGGGGGDGGGGGGGGDGGGS